MRNFSSVALSNSVRLQCLLAIVELARSWKTFVVLRARSTICWRAKSRLNPDSLWGRYDSLVSWLRWSGAASIR